MEPTTPVSHADAAARLARVTGARVEPARESGFAVLQVFDHPGPLPAVFDGFPVHPRHADFPVEANLENYGLRNHLAQSWTPHGVARLLWKGMTEAGFHPRTHPVIHDIAAGTGRLVEGLSLFCRVVACELDADLARLLRARFPSPHRVIVSDFRDLAPEVTGPVRALVSSPPWMEDGDGEWLPDAALRVAVRLLVPGGLAGFVLPEGYLPKTVLRPVAVLRPRDEDLEHARHEWNQRSVIRLFAR